MRKRVRIALAVVVATVLAVAGWEMLRAGIPNPIVDGKPLMSWLDNYAVGQPEIADHALEKVGTNAIPSLLWMLRQRDSSLKLRLIMPVLKQHFIKVRYHFAQQRNRAASLAFYKLGARAEAAVPDLIEIYQLKLSPSSQQATARSLGYIGAAANTSIPVLIRGMDSKNDLVRRDTLYALGSGSFRAETNLVVPVFISGLNDPDYGVRIFACQALANAGGAAKSAVPALIKASNDPDGGLQDLAVEALRQIDPEATAKAGVK